MQSLVVLNTSSTSHPNHFQPPCDVGSCFQGSCSLLCWSRLAKSIARCVRSYWGQRWRDGFNHWASSTLQCSSGFNSFKFVKRQFSWRIFLTSWNDLTCKLEVVQHDLKILGERICQPEIICHFVPGLPAKPPVWDEVWLTRIHSAKCIQNLD